MDLFKLHGCYLPLHSNKNAVNSFHFIELLNSALFQRATPLQ